MLELNMNDNRFNMTASPFISANLYVSIHLCPNGNFKLTEIWYTS